MRRLGMSLDPPPPPAFCGSEDALLPDNGEDNVAYDVSRSPSTEQDGHGRPMYHTYHDSGISAGLSPSQESEPRPGLGYRTCPDSGISIFGAQPAHCSHHVTGGFCQAQEPLQRQQQQQVFCDQIHVHAHPHQHQLHQPQAILHHNLVQASVHPSHGVCYGDDMTHSQSPQHYNPPSVHPASLNLVHYNERQQIGIVAHVHKPPAQHALPGKHPRAHVCPESPGYQLQSQTDQQCYSAGEITERVHNISTHTPPGRHGQDTAAIPTPADSQAPNRTPSCSGNFRNQYDLESDNTGQQYSSSSSSPSKPFRHSCRDSNAASNIQPAVSADRPESQASHSSTTDSEDSGFRSSHCAAHHSAALGKQGNPLLKPLRRTKANKPKIKPQKTASPNAEASRTNSATPLITLNPHNLQMNMENSNVIQNTSLMELDLVHRPSRIAQPNSANSISNDRLAMFPSTTAQGAVSSALHDNSPTRTQHCSPRDNWPPQSTNDEETKVNQNIDLSEISTHLSWKYLQDLTSSNTTYNGSANGSMVIQPCHQGIRPGQMLQNNHEQHMEMFGFSVV